MVIVRNSAAVLLNQRAVHMGELATVPPDGSDCTNRRSRAHAGGDGCGAGVVSNDHHGDCLAPVNGVWHGPWYTAVVGCRSLVVQRQWLRTLRVHVRSRLERWFGRQSGNWKRTDPPNKVFHADCARRPEVREVAAFQQIGPFRELSRRPNKVMGRRQGPSEAGPEVESPFAVDRYDVWVDSANAWSSSRDPCRRQSATA